jgi:hypothetical protein
MAWTDVCGACQKPWAECECTRYCGVCEYTTNHSTAQHLAAQESDEPDE